MNKNQAAEKVIVELLDRRRGRGEGGDSKKT